MGGRLSPVVKVPLFAILGITLLYFITAASTSSLLPYRIVASTSTSSHDYRDPIPNNVHYVQLMRDPHGSLAFQFKHFISAYAAHLYFQPDAIFIHTDATDEAIAAARSLDQPSKWTRLLFQIPKVSVRKVIAPNTTTSGVEISRLEHKSDFVRMDAVYELGGIYLDWDVHALRDIKPLRESGFANVVGREVGDGINNGCWMSKKETDLVALFIRDAHRVFDGAWATASTQLLKRLSERLVSVPNEVLIMDRQAFAPSTWREKDIRVLYEPHLDSAVPGNGSADGQNGYGTSNRSAVEQWDNQQIREDWESDYSSTYLIHAFGHPQDLHMANFTGITVPYVLSRQSNFARAVYPALRHALDSGLFSADD